MVKIKTQIANRANYGNQRSTRQIKYIVIHYTANDGDSDEGNGGYFQRNIVKASAHYFVDDDSITQSVPDDYVAYAVGGNRYNTAGGRLYGVATNTNSISVELCDTVKNGVIYPTQKTIENALELTRLLMGRYNVPIEGVIRHYDVNGKLCPAYWTDDQRWEKEFHGLILPKVRPDYKIGETYTLQSDLAVRSGAGNDFYQYKYSEYPAALQKKDANKDGKLDGGKSVKCNAVKILRNGNAWLKVLQHDYWVLAWNESKKKANVS